MIHENIYDFLMYGKLNNIPFGIVRSAFLDIMGETRHVVVNEKKKHLPVIYKYHRVEFHFSNFRNDATLFGIAFQPQSCIANHESFVFKEFELEQIQTLENVIETLNRLNVIHQSSKHDFNEKAIILTTVNQVKLYFQPFKEQDTLILCQVSKFQ